MEFYVWIKRKKKQIHYDTNKDLISNKDFLTAPIEMFIEINLDNRAWIDAHVKLIKRREFHIFNAQACFIREFRVEFISPMLVRNLQ